MKPNPIIRFLNDSDIPELIQLCKQHAEFEKSSFIETNKAQLLKEHFCAENSNNYCLVVELNQKLIGYATYMKQFSTWDANYYLYMDCLFLNDQSRGFGIGEKLIDQIKLEGKKLACNLIQWQTPDFNKRAMKFYDRIGAYSKTKERYFLELE